MVSSSQSTPQKEEKINLCVFASSPLMLFFSFNWYQSYKIKACFQSCLTYRLSGQEGREIKKGDTN